MSGKSFLGTTNGRFYRSPPTQDPVDSQKKGTIAFWGKLPLGQTGRAISFGQTLTLRQNANGTIETVGSDVTCTIRSTTAITFDGWHHFTIAADSSQVDQTKRCRLYLDGAEVNYASDCQYPVQDALLFVNSKYWYIGLFDWLGHIDKVYYIDNAQLTPDAFISGTPGAPILFTGNYGGAGFFIDFEDASSPTTMGYDTSGHGRHFLPNEHVTVAANSSTDAPGFTLATSGLVVSAPVINVPDFNSGIGGASLAVGSPQLSSASIDSAAPGSLVILPPSLGKPSLAMIGKNVLPDAVNLDGTQAPVLDSPRILSFVSITLGTGWGITDNVFIGGPFIDAKPSYGAVALIEAGGGTTGPYELYRSIAREAKVDVYRLMFDVAPTGSGKYVEIGLTDDSVGGVSATFDPETGECLVRNSLVVGSATVQSDWKLIGVEADPLLNNYYRLQIIAQVRAISSIRAYIRLIDETLDADYSGDGIGSIFVSDPRLLWSWDKRQFRWEIGPPEMRFYWTAHLSSLGLRWFRCGQGELGVDHHLEFINAPDLECVFRRWQPAQDELVFDYSGYLVAGTGNPLEGTP